MKIVTFHNLKSKKQVQNIEKNNIVETLFQKV